MPRHRKPSGGRSVSKTCQVQGLEGRWGILRKDRINTAVARLGPDGLTTDLYRKVPTADVFDERPTGVPTVAPDDPVDGVVGERGTITLPAELRRRLRMPPGSRYLIEERGGEIVIRPAEIVPRRDAAHPGLDELLAGVTPENLHEEVATGPAVGEEVW